MNQKGIATVAILVIGILIGAGIAGAYYLGTKQSTKTSKVADSAASPASTGLNQIQLPSEKTVKLQDLEFKIPSNWWHEEHLNDVPGKKWILVNSDPLTRPSDAIASFSVYYVPNQSVEAEKNRLIEALSLTILTEEGVKVGDVDGTKVEAKINLGPLEGKEVTLVLLSRGNDLYYLQSLSGNDNNFNEILSSLKFAE